MCSRFMPNVPKIYRQCAGRSTAIDSGSTRHTQVQNARPIRPVPSQVQNVPPVPPAPLPLGGASHTQLDSVIAALQQQTATLQRSQELQATATLRSWTTLIKFHAKIMGVFRRSWIASFYEFDILKFCGQRSTMFSFCFHAFASFYESDILKFLWTALHYVQFLFHALSRGLSPWFANPPCTTKK